MTTPSTPRKAGPLNGNGSTTAFPFTFKVFAASDVKVVIANSANVETVLVLNTNYTVSLNANQETSPGGTVTYPISGSPLPSGSVLSIIGNLDYSQPLDLPSGGNFSPIALENQLDRATMQIQQLKEQVDRSAKLPVTYDDSDLEAFTEDIVRLADSADNIDTLVANLPDITTVADDLNEPVSEINTVAGSIVNVNTVGNNIANVNTVAGVSANVTTVAGIQANVTTVAGIAANVTAVAGNAANINTVAGNNANVTAVGSNIANVNAVAANETSIDTVAGIASDVSAVAAIDSAVSIAATNVADINNFADVYLGGKAADPALRNDGSALQNGDLYFNTTLGRMRVRVFGVWDDAITNVGAFNVETFSGTGSQTVFTLSTDPLDKANCQIYISGVYQQKTKYNVLGTTLTFTTAPPAGTDNIEVVISTPTAFGNLSTIQADVTVKAATATTQAGIATTQAGIATTQAGIATTQATTATAAKTAAEVARDAAFVNAAVYTDTAAGLAATSAGQQFQVVSGDQIIRYRHDAGPVATEVARYPAADYVFDRLEVTSELSGYSFALLDKDSRVALGVRSTGVIEMPGTPTFNLYEDRATALSTLEFVLTDQDDRIAFAVNDAGAAVFPSDFIVKGQTVDLAATANSVSELLGDIYSKTVIDCWGDSLTQGNTTGVTTPYPTALASLLPGRTVNNRGRSGRTSLQIATAFGGVPSILTVTSNTIPASGGVAVTLTENGNLSSKSDFGTLNTVGSLFGIPGTLAVQFNSVNPNLAGTSTFTRTSAGSATVIPNRTPFIPATGGWEDNIAVIWSGKNDVLSAYADPTTYSNTFILANIQAMVDFIRPFTKQFVILTVTNSDSEYAAAGGLSTTAYNQILALNYEIARRWPRNYIDVRKILVNSYNPALPNDVIAFGRDTIPPSLFQDGLHLNNAGYAVVAQSVANFITAKGW
jgi:lysophospholipase L1-like esterase